MTSLDTPKVKLTVTSAPVRDVTYLVISDVHLYHRRTPTRLIIANLDAMFEDYSPAAAFVHLDAVFIAGDLFDQPCTSVDDLVAVLGWVYRLFDFAARHNIVVRILEGTPSHDCKQAKTLEPIAQSYKNNLDFAYIDKLHIEYIDRLGITALYVPDEWMGSTQKAQESIDALLLEKSIDLVDIAIMHGCFSFQIPQQKKMHLKYDEVFFLQRVRYFVNIGHDHTPKVHSRIIVQGSFDRCAHGEEHPKGACICYIRKDGNSGYTLVENKGAKSYVSVIVKTKDLDVGLAQARKKMSGLKPDSFVMIKAKAGHPILQSLDMLRKEFLYLYIEKDTLDDDDEVASKPAFETHDYIPIHIHKENICSLITQNVRDNNAISQEKMIALECLLKPLS